MDDFAQSREPDDLFSDDIELAEPQIMQEKPTTTSKASTNPTFTSQPSQTPRGRGAPSNRGSRRGMHNGLASSAHANPQADAQPRPTSTSPKLDDVTVASTSLPPTKTAPNTPAQDESRIASVRGDRSATGPAKPTKKTEAELSELMKAMQLKNAAKSEAHARAEKDQASFLQREQAAAQKRVEERKAIREQDLERAKNAQRKIKAQGGREWDSEKMEADVVDGRRSQYVRGAHGGVAGSVRGGGGMASSRYADGKDEEEMPLGTRGGKGGQGRGRGRGDFQDGGGDNFRGRGRRGRGGQINNFTKAPVLTADSEFPALPTKSTAAPKVGNNSLPITSPIGDGNWAEEMATPVEKA